MACERREASTEKGLLIKPGSYDVVASLKSAFVRVSLSSSQPLLHPPLLLPSHLCTVHCTVLWWGWGNWRIKGSTHHASRGPGMKYESESLGWTALGSKIARLGRSGLGILRFSLGRELLLVRKVLTVLILNQREKGGREGLEYRKELGGE